MSSTKPSPQRYSLAFKLKVVDEVERSVYSLGEATTIYGIKGHSTVLKWVRKYGKTANIPPKKKKKEVTTESIKSLEDERRLLESSLAKAHMRIESLESIINLASSHYKTDLKKNFAKNR